MTLKQKKNRQAVLIRKAAIAATLSVCLMQQVAAAEAVQEGTNKTEKFSASASNSTKDTSNKATEKKPVITKDQAIAKIKELFPQFQQAEVETITLGDPNIYPPRNEMVWTIQWKYQIGNNGYGFGSRVDALTGEILQVDFAPWSEVSREKVKYPPTYSREQAKELVEKLIQRIAPSIDIKNLQAQDYATYYDYGTGLFGPAHYSFSYNIPVNGLPSEESIYVSIDGEGNIFNYSRSESGLSYPSATPSIPAEKAKSLYAEPLKMELVYMPVGEPYGASKEMMLAYQPTNIQYGILDAKNGKFVDVTTGKDAIMLSNTYKSISPTTKRYTAHQGQELTADQAKAIALSIMKPPAEHKRMNQNIQKDWNDPKVKVWYLSWDNPSTMGSGGYDNQFIARINAATGQILAIGNPYQSFRNENNAEKKDPEISLADAEKKANYWINLLYPDATAHLQLITPTKEQNVQQNGGFHFEYQQFVGGIRVNYNSVRMELGSRGELVNYETSVQAVDIEAMKTLKPSMTAEEARTAFLDHFEMELRYWRVGPYDYNNTDLISKQEQRLVYSPKFNPEHETILNAVTGKFQADWYNARKNSSALTAKDIQGTTSEAAFTKLLQAGVLKPNEEGLVKPNDKIKLGEWMQWITQAVQPYSANEDMSLFKDINSDSPYYSGVSFFVSKGWLKKNPAEYLRPETEITREQLAESVSVILQYEQLANFLSKDLEVTQLQDAAEVNNKGVVALVLKLGVMSTDGGKFHPKSTVTRAEAAETIMKLVEIQGRVDSEIQR